MIYVFILFPAEVQLEIIHHTLLRSNSQCQWIDTKARGSVSQACRLWRSLVVNTSAFWTTISVTEKPVDLTISFDHPFALRYERALDIFPWTAALLQRSGSHPLDISINIESPAFNPDWPETKNMPLFSWTPAHSLVLAGILRRHASRFRTFSLVSELWHPIEAFTMAFAGIPMPLLQSWDVTRQNDRFGHLEHTDISLQPHNRVLELSPGILPTVEHKAALFPNLTRLSLSGVPQSWNHVIPRHNLVVLILEYLPLDCRPTYRELKDLLLSSQLSLMQFKLWAAAPLPDDTVSDDDKIVLPNLKDLAIGVSFTENVLSFIRHLDAPNLTSFEFGDMTYRNPRTWDEDVVVDGMTDTEIMDALYWAIITTLPLPQLTHLTLRGLSFPPEDIDQFEDALREERELEDPPVIHTFLLTCSSVRNLRLIDPDRVTLCCLASPIYVPFAETIPGLLPCSVLELLEIQTNNMGHAMTFLQLNSYWSTWETRLVVSRSLQTMILDVPPEWGTQLRGLVGRNTAKEVLNGQRGTWDLDDGEAINLMDHLFI